MSAQTELEAKIHEQAKQIRRMQIVAEEKNHMLDVLHMVWCDGGCVSGVHRYDGQGPDAVTDAVVDAAVASLALILTDETVPRHLKLPAVQYVGRLIRWRSIRAYRTVTAAKETTA